MTADDGCTPSLRLRAAASRLVTLPWRQPLESWSPADAPLVQVPLGTRHHVVRVVEVGERLWVLKQSPRWAAEREHAVLVALERRGVPAVRPAGLVTRDAAGDAVLITQYEQHAVLWRDVLTDLPDGAHLHRARVYEAVALFLVDLHRRGVFWGDCSLSNLLLRRDGQVLQPLLVDAETAEVWPLLTDRQRRQDLDIVRDNLAGLSDLAAEAQRPVDLQQLGAGVRRIAARYDELWQALHAQARIPYTRRQDAVDEVERLNHLGYAVEEVRLTSSSADRDELQLQTLVADRLHDASELQRLTGLQVGEGQAAVLLSDLRSHGRALPVRAEPEVVRSWLEQVVRPAVERLGAALPGPRDVVQDYCDLLEVRWLLSEQAGRDVGDGTAVQVLAAGGVPAGAAAELGRTRTRTHGWAPELHPPQQSAPRRRQGARH